MILADRGRRVLHLDEMPIDVASALYLHGLSQGVCTHVYTFSDEYVHNPGEWQRRYMSNIRSYVRRYDPFQECTDQAAQ